MLILIQKILGSIIYLNLIIYAAIICVFFSTFFCTPESNNQADLIRYTNKVVTSSKTDFGLIVYTALGDRFVLLKQAFESVTGIRTGFIRMGTGEIFHRLKLESISPFVDVVVGGSVEWYIAALEKGYITSFKPNEISQLDYFIRNYKGITGYYFGIMGLAVNMKYLRNRHIPIPQTWNDLLKPIYRKLIIMSDPTRTGTGFTTIATFIRGSKNEDIAFKKLKALYNNINHLVLDPKVGVRFISHGKAAISILFYHDAVNLSRSFPIKAILLKGGSGWEIGGIAKVTGAPNPENAKTFINWMLSKEAQSIMPMAGLYQYPSNIHVPTPKGIPPRKYVHSLILHNFNFQYLKQRKNYYIRRWQNKILK